MRTTLIALIFFFSSSLVSAQIDNNLLSAFAKNFAEKHNRTEAEILSILDSATYQQEIIDKITRPAEGTMTWKRYRNIFIKDERIEAGVKFWEAHEEAIEKVSKDTGVPPEVILGIIGVETYYGQRKGSYKVLDALYTLGFGYPKRGKFFRSELEKFILLAESEKLDLYNIKGSYAGAMGYGQFMPSSYMAYAKSYEPDGTIDLMGSPEDAIASVANYIKVHRWRKDEPISTTATFTREVKNLNKQSLRPKNKVSDYTALDIEPGEDIDKNLAATLIILDNGDGEKEYHYGFYNFYVITRYNHSPMYAMAVYQLGKAVVNKKPR